MAPLFTYICLTFLIAMTLCMTILHNPGNADHQKADRLCSKLNDMFQSKGCHERNEANKNRLRALYLIGCKKVEKRAPSSVIERRSNRAALLDLLDYVIKPVQKEPIFAPSVLLPEKPKPSVAFRIWEKLFYTGK